MAFASPEPTIEKPGFFWNATNGTFLRVEHVSQSALECSDLLWKDNLLNLYQELDPSPLEWCQLRPSF